jgi:hypothetical protein
MSQAINFRYTEDEYVSAERMYSNRTHGTVPRLLVSIVLFLIGIVLWIYIEGSVVWLTLFCVGATIMGAALAAFFVMPHVRFRRNARWHGEYSFGFSEEGLQFESAHLDSKIKWSMYRDVLENKKLYALIYDEAALTIIPKRIFTDEVQASLFRGLLQKKIVMKRQVTS